MLIRAGAAMLATGLVLDIVWLKFVANDFFQRHLGSHLRPDVQYGPAALFYVVYVLALLVFVVHPAVEKQSLSRALSYGAFFGFVAYSAFDLTGLSLFRDFPLKAAALDLAWGSAMSATTCAVGYLAARTALS